MEITLDLIRELSALSRLEVREEDLAIWQSDLQKMVAFVEQLQRVDTRGVEPLIHLSLSTRALREDRVSGTVSRESALHQAPEAVTPYFSVPKVIISPNRTKIEK